MGVDALAGGPFAEEVALVPPEPPAVGELVPVESPAEKRARVAEELHKREQEAAWPGSLFHEIQSEIQYVSSLTEIP